MGHNFRAQQVTAGEKPSNLFCYAVCRTTRLHNVNPNVLPVDPNERNVRLLEHRPLVRSIAGRMRSRLPANVEMDELVQAGMIGLNEAISRFEEGRGASFGTYAARRIEGAMLDTLRANDSLSRDVRSKLRQVQAASQGLEHRLGRTPRAKEVATELGWTLDAFYNCMLHAGAGPTRFPDEPLEGTWDQVSAAEASAEEHTDGGALDEHADPQRLAQRSQRQVALAEAFAQLDERERTVMEMIYDRELGLAEIGEALGVSASRISKMHEAIVGKLRLRLRNW